jgi:hypothetical protein
MRPTVRWLGAALSVAGLAYVLAFGLRHRGTLGDLELSPAGWGGLVVGVALYQLTFVTSAGAWRLLLSRLGASLTAREAFSILARSQVAKYLPGNVGHYVGRVVLARSAGLTARPVMLAMVFETAAAVLAGALVAVVGLVGSPRGQAVFGELGTPAALAIGLALTALVGGLILLERRGVWEWLRLPADAAVVGAGRGTWPKVAAACLGLLAVNFLILGGCATVVARLALGLTEPGLPLLTSLFAAAWVAGFVAPGAPAGLGVREAILVAGFDAFADARTAFLLPLLFRLVTTAGDAVGFGLGWLTRRVADG